jgi:hypothetical protein
MLEELETENRMLRARNDRLEREAAERELAKCLAKRPPALMQIAEPHAPLAAEVSMIRAALMRQPSTTERANALASLDKMAAAMGEPEAMRYDFDGYGYKYIDSGSGSDWRTRHPGAEPLFTKGQV